MKRVPTFLLIAFTALFSACGTSKKLTDTSTLVPFTDSVRKSLSRHQLETAQFFTGPDPITIERAISHKGTAIGKNGEVITNGVETSEVITIPPYTPGVIIPNGIDQFNEFKISYVKGDNTLYFVFGPSRLDPSHKYILLFLNAEKGNTDIRYGKYIFHMNFENQIVLHYKPKEFNSSHNSSRTEKGWRVKNK